VTLDTLIDPRTGIIRRLERLTLHPHLPAAFRSVASRISDTATFSPWPSDPSGAGCAAWDEAAARAAAIGEAVERYCGNLVPPLEGLTLATYDDMCRRVEPVIDPSALALYAPQQYALPGFPFVPFTRHTYVRWTRGESLATGEPVWVPASLVWVTYYRGPSLTPEPRTSVSWYGGIATGPTATAARWSALQELVERDAVTLGWTGRGDLVPLQPPGWLDALAASPTNAVTTRFLSFPTDLGLPVIGALVEDHIDGYTTLGLSCRPDPAAAAVKALVEAVRDQMVVRDLDDPASAMARVAATADSPLKPWRADRAYRRLYRPDLRDVTDPGCHLQLHLDPAVQADFARELTTALGPPHPLDHTATGTTDPLTDTLRLLTDQGFRVIAVDVTTDDVRAAGLHVARVIVPGLYNNAPAAYPYLGGTRMPTQLAGRPPRLLAPAALTPPALDRLTGWDATGYSHSDRSGCYGSPTPCPQPAARSPTPSCRSCSTS
jgi:ribosomal protein S12 methylthiotransferase accessory factor